MGRSLHEACSASLRGDCPEPSRPGRNSVLSRGIGLGGALHVFHRAGRRGSARRRLGGNTLCLLHCSRGGTVGSGDVSHRPPPANNLCVGLDQSIARAVAALPAASSPLAALSPLTNQDTSLTASLACLVSITTLALSTLGSNAVVPVHVMPLLTDAEMTSIRRLVTKEVGGKIADWAKGRHDDCEGVLPSSLTHFYEKNPPLALNPQFCRYETRRSMTRCGEASLALMPTPPVQTQRSMPS